MMNGRRITDEQMLEVVSLEEARAFVRERYGSLQGDVDSVALEAAAERG